MAQHKRSPLVASPLEKILAILAASACVLASILLWWSLRLQQPMWTLPGLYFIESGVLSILSAFLFIRGREMDRIFTWLAAGMLLGFAMLGIWSVGFFYMPVPLVFIGLSIFSDIRHDRRLLLHLLLCLMGGIAQMAVMFAVIR
jgi:hypothetical protein